MSDLTPMIPWFLSVLTVVTMLLAGNKNPLAWWLGIGSQAIWLYFDWTVQAWGLMPLAVVLTAIYWRNLRRWRRDAQIIKVEPVVGCANADKVVR